MSPGISSASRDGDERNADRAAVPEAGTEIGMESRVGADRRHHRRGIGSTGSVSTGVFQMLLAGSTGQPPIVCCAWEVPPLTMVVRTISDIERATRRAMRGVFNFGTPGGAVSLSLQACRSRAPKQIAHL